MSENKKPKTVIAFAKELVELHGKEKAIEYFKSAIDVIEMQNQFVSPKPFDVICKIASYETAIEFINEKL